MKKISKLCISLTIFLSLLFNLMACEKKEVSKTGGDVYIYNFGDYLSEDAIELFEKETGIRIHQDVFEANEEVIPVIESGAKYDVICISDYCIERMREKDLLLPLDKTKIQNIKNINKEKYDMLSNCDPGNTYAVPYFCGSMGIFFNKTKLDEMGVAYPRKWADLFNPALKGELIMQSSIRDLYTVGLRKNGFSVNSTNKDEIDICTEEFIAQKPYVQGYFTDQVKEKILSGEAAIAPITSGDVQYVYLAKDDEGLIEEDETGKTILKGDDQYAFIIPEEGTQFFIDAWCILKNAENVENAYKFIDYMCREDVARLNAEYVGYETVNDKTPDEEFLYMRKIDGAYFDYSNGNNELERDVKDAIKYYSDGYNRIKAS